MYEVHKVQGFHVVRDLEENGVCVAKDVDEAERIAEGLSILDVLQSPEYECLFTGDDDAIKQIDLYSMALDIQMAIQNAGGPEAAAGGA